MTTPIPQSGRPAVIGWLRWSLEPRDAHRVATGPGAAALAAAAGMAVFGLPPVDLHGLLHHVGIMDPLCGTPAPRPTPPGGVGAGVALQPLGILAVLAAAVAVLRATTGALTGRWVTLTVVWTHAG